MLRSLLSEWVKLRRRAMVLGGGGTIVAFAALTTMLTFTTASSTPGDAAGPGASATTGQLASADGLALTIAGTATFIGVVTLAVWAIAVAGEYSQGTLRNLLVRQPRRLRLLAGKLLALASFTAAALVVAAAVASVVAVLLAPGRDIATAAWVTGDGLAALGAGFGNLLLATLGWGLLGALLALLLRSPAAAVGAGVAYALPFELVIATAWASGARWLPGQLLGTLADGGAATVSYGRAALVLTLYGTLTITLCATLFTRRDVTA
jgi:ABC-2 type transport system permease protein